MFLLKEEMKREVQSTIMGRNGPGRVAYLEEDIQQTDQYGEGPVRGEVSQRI